MDALRRDKRFSLLCTRRQYQASSRGRGESLRIRKVSLRLACPWLGPSGNPPRRHPSNTATPQHRHSVITTIPGEASSPRCYAISPQGYSFSRFPFFQSHLENWTLVLQDMSAGFGQGLFSHIQDNVVFPPCCGKQKPECLRLAPALPAP